MKVFIDMDGVLVNLPAAAFKFHRILDIYAHPKNLGNYSMHETSGLSREDFWSLPSQVWQDAPKMPDADAIVNLCIANFGPDNVAFLSMPGGRDISECIKGKMRWIDRHYPGFKKKCIFTAHKGLLAHQGALLLDDSDEQVQFFRDRDGNCILVPQAWNRMFSLRDKSYEFVAQEIQRYVS